MKISLMFLLTILLSAGCDFSDDVLFHDNPDGLPGEWLLVETSFSAGAEQEYREVKNGGRYTFRTDGTFTSTQLDGCGRGTYQLKDDKLILVYDCDTRDSPNPFTFRITFEDNYFMLSPISIMCIEGCTSKFKKVKEE
ncbi:MAG TPA: lipocalin family protein [Cyclobacteriaceae bacterium]|nr:lipocalin family protein [Cyclobacteriaceae bacterium]